MRLLPAFTRLLPALSIPVLLAAQDPKDIIRQALQVNTHNEDVARNYTYLERQERRTLDSSGRVQERKVENWDVTLLEGSPYRRLVGRNDQPLSPAEQKKEEEKLRKSIEERSKETEEQRQRRIAEWRRRQDERRREPVREVPEAFDFRLVGEERIEGFDAWVIEGRPRPGFKGKSTVARALYPKVVCRFWIHKSDYQAIKVNIETLDTASLGLFFVRLAKGSRISIELTRVNDEVWLPKHIEVSAAARVMLFKSIRLDMQVDYSNYKKFQAESRVVSTEEKK